MTNKQTSKKNMYNRVMQFFALHASVWATYNRLKDEISSFVDTNEQIETYLGKQQQTTTGVTSAKNDKYLKMVTITVKFARKARVWAEDDNNLTLEAIFDIRESDFEKIAAEVGESKIKDVRDALNTNIASLAPYNVLPADVTAIDDAITAYHSISGTPGAAIANKKLGTEALVILFNNADKSLAKIDDLLINEYMDTEQKPIAIEYQNNRVIINIGKHHQGLDAHITYADGSGDAEGVTLTLVELNKSELSDIQGMVDTIRGKVGTYHVRLEGTGIVTKEIIASIKAGEVTHLAVQVEKA